MMNRMVVATLALAVGSAAFNALAPATPARAASKEHKVAICHGTASAKNPYVLIIVDESAKAAHLAGHGQNSAPDYVLNGGNVLTVAQEVTLRAQGDSACGCSTPALPSGS